MARKKINVNMLRKRRGIFVKFVLAALLVSVVSGAIILGVALNEQRQVMKDNLIQENTRLAQVAAESIEAGYAQQAWPFKTLNQISNSEDVMFWWIVKPDGTIYLADNPEMYGKSIEIDTTSFEADHTAVKDMVYSGENIKLLIQPLNIGEPGKAEAFCMGISLKSVTAATNRMIVSGLCFFGVIIAFAGVFSLFLARTFTNPLLQLVEGTKAISSGDLDHRVKIKSGDEIEELGNAFNEMAGQIKEREEELKEAQDYTKAQLYNVPNPVSVLDLEGRRINTSKAAEIRHRLSRNEILGTKAEELYAKEDAEKIRKCIEECKTSGFSSCEATCMRGDGTTAPFLLSFRSFRNKEGKLVNIMFSSTDISELRKRKEELEESRAYFQHFFDSSPVPLTLIGLDGKRLDCNPAMEELTDKSKEELTGIPVEASYPEEEQELVRKKLVDETIEKGYISEFETHFIRPDGTKLPIIANTALIRDQNDKPLSIIYSATDITELKLREEEHKLLIEELETHLEELKKASVIFEEVLAKAAKGDLSSKVDLSSISEEHRTTGENINKMIFATEEYIDELHKHEAEIENMKIFLNSALDSINSPVYMFDTDAKTTYVNPAFERLFGFSKREILGLTFEEFSKKVLVPEVRDTISKRVKERVKTGEPVGSVPTECLTKDGKRIPFLYSASGIRDKEGIVIQEILTATDVTELKKREEDLKAKNVEMERFTYIISHDLRSPLVTIQGFIDMLRKDIAGDKKENIENDLKMIANAAIKMNELLTDTLKLSRIGRIINPPEEVPFGELVKEALEQTAEEIKSNNVEVSVAGDLPNVHVDQMRIVEVLMNLISNSIKFMRDQPHPKIEIGHRLDKGETVFFVRDNGIGIEPSQHEKVFEIFYKIDEKSEGTGAGLAIVKRIIEVHGGRIRIESEGKMGKGCTFCFTLPEK